MISNLIKLPHQLLGKGFKYYRIAPKIVKERYQTLLNRSNNSKAMISNLIKVPHQLIVR
jgi:hypothetical protein